MELMTKHCEELPPAVSDFVSCPPELAALVAQLLAKERSDRPVSAEAVVTQLQKILAGETSESMATVSADEAAVSSASEPSSAAETEPESLTSRLYAPQPAQREVSWKMLAIVGAIVVIGIAALSFLNSGS